MPVSSLGLWGGGSSTFGSGSVWGGGSTGGGFPIPTATSAGPDWLGSLTEIAKVAIPAVISYRQQEIERDVIKMNKKQRKQQQQQQQYYQPQLQTSYAARYAQAPQRRTMPAPYTQVGWQEEVQQYLGNGPDIPGVDIAPQGGATVFTPWVRTMAGYRAQAYVDINPATGAAMYFRPAGRPILFSRDLGIVKKVQKLARRAKRATR